MCTNCGVLAGTFKNYGKTCCGHLQVEHQNVWLAVDPENLRLILVFYLHLKWLN